MINAPDENLFYKNSKRLIAEAGNVFFLTLGYGTQEV